MEETNDPECQHRNRSRCGNGQDPGPYNSPGNTPAYGRQPLCAAYATMAPVMIWWR